MEDLTWTEIRAQMEAGTRTVIIPTGGTEQNGPHLVTGKHNHIVRHTAEAIATQLGQTLVAPVMAYVPQGTIDPPQDHMRFAGTLSLREQTFAAVLEDAARSLKQHGFTRIYFIGDHGGSQPAQQSVAEKLSKEWHAQGIHVVAITHYYTNPEATTWAESNDVGVKNPQAHAGFMDTSELLATHPSGVRRALIGNQKPDANTTGVAGDPSQATAAYGKKLLDFKVKSAIEQIKHLTPNSAGK